MKKIKTTKEKISLLEEIFSRWDNTMRGERHVVCIIYVNINQNVFIYKLEL